MPPAPDAVPAPVPPTDHACSLIFAARVGLVCFFSHVFFRKNSAIFGLIIRLGAVANGMTDIAVEKFLPWSCYIELG